jgi:hypothetical protein
MGPDEAFPPELQALAQRLSADGALWQSRLPDPAAVAERIRNIPTTFSRTLPERGFPMSTQVNRPPAIHWRPPTTGNRPPRRGPGRGILAGLAAVLVVALLAVLLVLLAARGASTGPIGQPTPTATPPQVWTTIQAFTGSGTYTSPSFQVTSPWRLVWQCNVTTGNPGPYPLQVGLLSTADSGGASEVVNTNCETGNTSGTSAEATTPTGQVYLNVSSAADGEWDVRVQVPRSAPSATVAPTTPPTYLVYVYFSKQPDSYNNPNIVFAVERNAPAVDDATYAIQQLIAGPTPAEASAGYFTELTAALSGPSNCGGADFTLALNMRGTTPQPGTATLQFCRATTLPGDMTGPRIKAEITKTLMQFPGITAVVILNQAGHCFDDLIGGDRCLQ